MTTDEIYKAVSDISHRTDGPVTPFVLMARATELVAKGRDPEVIANALFTALEDLGVNVRDEDACAASEEY